MAGLCLEVSVELEEVELEEVGPETWSFQLLLSLQGTAHLACCSGSRLKLFTKLGAPAAGSSSVGWS